MFKRNAKARKVPTEDRWEDRGNQKIAFLLAAVLTFPAVAAGDPVLAPKAPTDKPFSTRQEEMAALEKAIQPFIRQARATYPAARKRFQAGLPPGESFFVTTRLHDTSGAFEQVFVAVQRIESGVVTGRIWSNVQSVRGFKYGDVYRFSEEEILDWLISKPDGSEEGNYVGKFLDTYQSR